MALITVMGMPLIDITDIGLTVITGIDRPITDGGEGILGEMAMIGMIAMTGASVHRRTAGVTGIIRRITERAVRGAGAPMSAAGVIGDVPMWVAGVAEVVVQTLAAGVDEVAVQTWAVGVEARRTQAEDGGRKDRDGAEEFPSLKKQKIIR